MADACFCGATAAGLGFSFATIGGARPGASLRSHAEKWPSSVDLLAARATGQACYLRPFRRPALSSLRSSCNARSAPLVGAAVSPPPAPAAESIALTCATTSSRPSLITADSAATDHSVAGVAGHSAPLAMAIAATVRSRPLSVNPRVTACVTPGVAVSRRPRPGGPASCRWWVPLGPGRPAPMLRAQRAIARPLLRGSQGGARCSSEAPRRSRPRRAPT